MKTRFHVGVLLVFILTLMPLSTVLFTRDAGAADPVILTLFDPTGATEVTELHAPRLGTLAGKTICELSNDGWESDRTFPLIRGLLQNQFPTAKFIPFTEFPRGQFGIDTDEAAILVAKKGCQAVIVGNAG